MRFPALKRGAAFIRRGGEESRTPGSTGLGTFNEKKRRLCSKIIDTEGGGRKINPNRLGVARARFEAQVGPFGSIKTQRSEVRGFLLSKKWRMAEYCAEVVKFVKSSYQFIAGSIVKKAGGGETRVRKEGRFLELASLSGASGTTQPNRNYLPHTAKTSLQDQVGDTKKGWSLCTRRRKEKKKNIQEDLRSVP